MGHSQRNTASRGSIQLGQDHATQLSRLGKDAGLLQPILPQGSIQNQEGFHDRPWGFLVHNPANLAEFVHQVFLVLEPPSGIHQQEFGVARLGGGDRIKHHRSRIGVLPWVGNHLHPRSLPPNLHLLHRRRPERIRRRNQTTIVGFHGKVGQFANGGGFACPVHAGH